MNVQWQVSRQKNDAADAEAICEAAQRPRMRFVAVKSAEQQAVLSLHKARELLVRQKTMLINAIRGHAAEFGLIAPLGARQVDALIEDIRSADDARLVPDIARAALSALADQLHRLIEEVARLDRRLMAWHRQNAVSQRLASIPGVGLIGAAALAASIADPGQFRSGREFAAFLGLVPRQSVCGKERLGRISKMGDRYLRKLLVVGATSARRAKAAAAAGVTAAFAWINGLLARKPARVATVAMANKTARIAWALMRRAETYRTTPALASA
jgi:transposase